MSGATETEGLRRKRGINTSHSFTYADVSIGEHDNTREEKPFQRVPSYYFLLAIGFYLLLAYLTQLVEDDMPRVVNDKDIDSNNPQTFSEESSWRYLKQIIGDEPRVAGTLYHYEKTKDLKAMLDNIAANAKVPVWTDWQIVTGDYFLNTSAGFVNYYVNASNIIALLEGESGVNSNGSIGSSILVNCHYDSVPYALGASDNAVFCAVMAETLSKLSQRKNKLKHNIIFLFNGAEENPLQASHGFLKHKWARAVTAVINLDAAGMNGKPTIFQVTDPRILTAYRRSVSKPNAQSFGEALFASGIIPSDTDFRIWRDFGTLHGIDMAFVKWGQVYHTRYDHPAFLRPGVQQWAGDMMLRLLTLIGDTPEFSMRQSNPSSAVYCDYLNLFLITYPLVAAPAVDAGVIVVALVSVGYYVWLVGIRWSTCEELVYASCGRVLSAGAGALATLAAGALVAPVQMQLRYLSHPWLVVPFYWLPYIVVATAVSHQFGSLRTRKSGLNRSLRTLEAMAATRLLLCVTLLVTVCFPSTATMRYVFAAPLCIMSLASLVSLTAVRCVRLTAWQHLLMEMLLSLPSTMFMFSLALRVNSIMLPIMGRNGASNPDLIVAILNGALVTIVATTVSGIELVFSRKRLWCSLTALGGACVVLMLIPLSPYQDEGPSTMRHYWFHSQISSYNANMSLLERTSGVLITKHDAYSIQRVQAALSTAPQHYNTRTDFTEDCDKYIYCNLPMFRKSLAGDLSKSLFLYTEPPTLERAPTLLYNRTCVGETCTYHFVLTGGAHNLVTLQPEEGVALTSWSFESDPRVSFSQRGRPVYSVFHSAATHSEPYVPVTFNVTLIVPLSVQRGVSLLVSHHSHSAHSPGLFSEPYRRLQASMPPYFHIATFLSVRDNYLV